MATNSSNHETPAYIPALHLYNNSLLTAPQLTSLYQDFYASLDYVSCAPAFVFERLVANLAGAFTETLERERLGHKTTLEQERAQHTTATEKLNDDIKGLQSSNDQLERELTELKTASKPALEAISSAAGTFYAHDVRRPIDAKPLDQSSRVIPFPNPYPAPPALSVGLNLFDASNKATIRVDASTTSVQNDRFEINVKTWGDSILRDGGCAWLATNDPDFQFGTYSTGEDHSWAERRKLNTRQVTFSQAYSASPNVVVWIRKLDMSVDLDWRVKAYATNITATGFTIHVDAWRDSWLAYITASWIAYPADKPGVSSGTFSTLDIRPTDSPQLHNNGYISFGDGVFKALPRVLVAINSLDVSCKSNLRLAVKTSNISANGMMWHLDSWDDSVLYSAGASYIALT